ncbi:MAG: hypothetical protein K2Q25_01840 [Mycobacteriaceae bacterium]|nr:hypothetical protein [Mycobacteriaceae bacterium]
MRPGQSGELLALAKGDFTGYSHTPAELRHEITLADLSLVDLVGIEGTPMSTNELARRLADPVERRALFDAARAIERVPELLGMSLHLLATCTR